LEIKLLLVDKIPKVLLPIFYRMFQFFHVVEAGYWKHIYNEYRKTYEISPLFYFRGVGIDIGGNFKFFADENSYIGEHATVNLGGGNVTIGKNVGIGRRFKVHTYGTDVNDILSGKEKESWKLKNYGDVIIKDNVWIGDDVTVRGGIEVGQNSVIGFNSVVTRSIPAYSVAVGNPAKVVKLKDK
jgi:maltose O-acetyltransferase